MGGENLLVYNNNISQFPTPYFAVIGEVSFTQINDLGTSTPALDFGFFQLYSVTGKLLVTRCYPNIFYQKGLYDPISKILYLAGYTTPDNSQPQKLSSQALQLTFHDTDHFQVSVSEPVILSTPTQDYLLDEIVLSYDVGPSGSKLNLFLGGRTNYLSTSNQYSPWLAIIRKETTTTTLQEDNYLLRTDWNTLAETVRVWNIYSLPYQDSFPVNYFLDYQGELIYSHGTHLFQLVLGTVYNHNTSQFDTLFQPSEVLPEVSLEKDPSLNVIEYYVTGEGSPASSFRINGLLQPAL